MDISKHFLNVGVLGAHFALCGVPLVRMLLACCRIWGGAASFPSPSKNSAQQCITKGGWVAAAEESKDTFDSKHACVQMKAMDAWLAKHGKTCVSPACAQAKLSCSLVISVIRLIAQFHLNPAVSLLPQGSSSSPLQEYRGTDIVFARNHDCNGKQIKHKWSIYTYSDICTHQDTVSEISELIVWHWTDFAAPMLLGIRGHCTSLSPLWPRLVMATSRLCFSIAFNAGSSGWRESESNSAKDHGRVSLGVVAPANLCGDFFWPLGNAKWPGGECEQGWVGAAGAFTFTTSWFQLMKVQEHRLIAAKKRQLARHQNLPWG